MKFAWDDWYPWYAMPWYRRLLLIASRYDITWWRVHVMTSSRPLSICDRAAGHRNWNQSDDTQRMWLDMRCLEDAGEDVGDIQRKW